MDGQEMLSDVLKKHGIHHLPERPSPNTPFPAGTVYWPVPTRGFGKVPGKGGTGGKPSGRARTSGQPKKLRRPA
jgi:hypothetical protein